MEQIRISQTGVAKANNKFIEEYPIGLEGLIDKKDFLLIIRKLNTYNSFNYKFLFFIIFFFGGFGMIVAGSVMKLDRTYYQEKIVLALIIIGSIVTITGVILLGFSFRISAASYKKNIQSFLLVVNKDYKSKEIVWEFERQLVDDYYKYYIKISFPRTIQRFENSEREVDPTFTISQYYPPSPTPYSQNSYGPSSSSSSPPPLTTITTIKSLPPPEPLPYIYEQAQSVPLPQEILDMLELEERNAAKDI